MNRFDTFRGTVVTAQARLAGQLVEQRQARLRPVAHRHRRGPVQRDDRGDGTRPSSTS
jgi:hypothetical protein